MLHDAIAKLTREECMRAGGRAFLQIAIRLELERRALKAYSQRMDLSLGTRVWVHEQESTFFAGRVIDGPNHDGQWLVRVDSGDVHHDLRPTVGPGEAGNLGHERLSPNLAERWVSDRELRERLQPSSVLDSDS